MRTGSLASQRSHAAEALAGLPAIAHQNAAACGTDVLSYVAEAPAVSAFALQDGTVYQTYTTTWRGLEFIMGCFNPRPCPERTRRGRRRLADLDPPPRRVRTVLTGIHSRFDPLGQAEAGEGRRVAEGGDLGDPVSLEREHDEFAP
jgi:hypothetical protein